MSEPIEVIIVKKDPPFGEFVGFIITALAVAVLIVGAIVHSVFHSGPPAVTAQAYPVVTATGPHTVDVRWTVRPASKAKDVSGFDVSVALRANNSPTFYSVHYPSSTHSAVIRNLAARTDYTISIMADGGSSQASPIAATTKTESGDTPTALVAAVMRTTQITSTSVTLKWYVPGRTTVRAESFALDACWPAGHPRMRCVNYEVNLPGTTFTYTYSGLTPAKNYTFGMTTYGTCRSYCPSSSIKARTK